ncbi:MAG: hypothetical protein EBZ76_03510, partial [Synechococcaceae bacterium WB9_2_170]|nr:hypothetical protein [Synechococcaceae bacterium WB9_2_170]
MYKSAESRMHQRLENVVAGMAAGTILSFAAATLGQPPAPTGAPTQHGQPSLSLTTGGLALGGLVGLLSASRRRQQAHELLPSDAAGEPWTGWREFRVSRKHPESAEITSFELQPVDGEALPAF